MISMQIMRTVTHTTPIGPSCIIRLIPVSIEMPMRGNFTAPMNAINQAYIAGIIFYVVMWLASVH
jgi:hypothetical protein